MQLNDKTAIVTGAASGIGKEIARHFSSEGAKVAIADLNLDAARAAAAELDPSGAATLAIRMDVTDEAQVDAGVDEVAGASAESTSWSPTPASRSSRPSTSSSSATGRRCSPSIWTAPS